MLWATLRDKIPESEIPCCSVTEVSKKSGKKRDDLLRCEVGEAGIITSICSYALKAEI